MDKTGTAEMKSEFAEDEIVQAKKLWLQGRLSAKSTKQTVSKAQRIRSNSLFSSRIIKEIPERAIKQAKLGHRSLELISLMDEDFPNEVLQPGKVGEASVFQYGSVAFFLTNLLLQAGFQIEIQANEELQEEVLVMSW